MRPLEKPHLRIVVPSHDLDLAPKTLRTIIAQAEISVDEFLNLM
ncbi:MAG: hypothetical protein HQK60_08435 [Deltaproteobacteria bacterium]|nr:hypothetical protein [Deltaproteobacteria bacterium]